MAKSPWERKCNYGAIVCNVHVALLPSQAISMKKCSRQLVSPFGMVHKKSISPQMEVDNFL